MTPSQYKDDSPHGKLFSVVYTISPYEKDMRKILTFLKQEEEKIGGKFKHSINSQGHLLYLSSEAYNHIANKFQLTPLIQVSTESSLEEPSSSSSMSL